MKLEAFILSTPLHCFLQNRISVEPIVAFLQTLISMGVLGDQLMQEIQAVAPNLFHLLDPASIGAGAGSGAGVFASFDGGAGASGASGRSVVPYIAPLEDANDMSFSSAGGLALAQQQQAATGGAKVELDTLVSFMDCLDVVHAYPKFEQTLLKIVRDYPNNYLQSEKLVRCAFKHLTNLCAAQQRGRCVRLLHCFLPAFDDGTGANVDSCVGL